MLLDLIYSIYYGVLFRTKDLRGLLGRSLLGPSFRLQGVGKTGIFIYHKAYLTAILGLVKSKSSKIELPSKGDKIIFDSKSIHLKQRQDFIRHFSGQQVYTGIARDDLQKAHPPGGMLKLILHLTFIYIALWPFSWIKKYKDSASLLFLEYPEWRVLFNFIQKNEIREVYHFCIYQKDSNFITSQLQKIGVKTYKSTSEVPISFWNRFILSDELIVCNGYQHEEMERNKETIFVNSFVDWGPERAFEVDQLYANLNEAPVSKGSIGYYSTAAWIREREKHMDQGFSMAKNEQMMLRFLADYSREHNREILIFPHPREKREEYRQEAKAWYKKAFEGAKYRLIESDKGTTHLFNQADLVVSFYSSVQYERLYFGFKTLFYIAYSDAFPLENTSMSNICASNADDLKKLIEKNIDLSRSEFFSQNNLNHVLNKKMAS